MPPLCLLRSTHLFGDDIGDGDDRCNRARPVVETTFTESLHVCGNGIERFARASLSALHVLDRSQAIDGFVYLVEIETESFQHGCVADVRHERKRTAHDASKTFELLAVQVARG